ncbi:MAG: peptidylprolyl isomerase [Limosilactobacillus sp.]|jgi:peptidyl-prolyl cis-trans isomerase B (cyclophilin B)|uniref:peptidylprolyl isomerase n=1 Tax=Limosilactobacillus sp. TaxID=2773925 RepID=UPI0025BD0325|nr:peptidylprolyl isomerase [Limosilactobacillus sp.]MCI1974574.1 peptidylprolyl isomerase [Limosilactobacillus sp.]MCI2031202.1 peptidylprolyl isomerase [Limosilactobacillus sp.]
MQYPQLNLAAAKGPQVTIKTNLGEITIQLFEKQAPKTVNNFIQLAEKGYYDGVIFHRVIPDFMIQGGDLTGTGRGGKSIYGKVFEDEFSDELFNFTGAVSMANAGPNTNGSQFFIVSNEHVPANMIEQMKVVGYPEEIIDHYAEVGGTPWLDHRHTVFGQVIDGMDVVKKISQAKRDNMDKPKKDIIMEKVTVNNND